MFQKEGKNVLFNIQEISSIENAQILISLLFKVA